MPPSSSPAHPPPTSAASPSSGCRFPRTSAPCRCGRPQRAAPHYPTNLQLRQASRQRANPSLGPKSTGRRRPAVAALARRPLRRGSNPPPPPWRCRRRFAIARRPRPQRGGASAAAPPPCRPASSVAVCRLRSPSSLPTGHPDGPLPCFRCFVWSFVW